MFKRETLNVIVTGADAAEGTALNRQNGYIFDIAAERLKAHIK